MTPTPVTAPEHDTGRRAQSVYDLEETLVKFLTRIFTSYRLDNPTLNLAQPEVVPFDYTQRAQALEQKVSPRIIRGRIPRTVAGEIAVDKLPDVPAVLVQAIAAKIEQQETTATVRILCNAYDENPDSGGYQDVQNMSEHIWIALTSFGQESIDHAYPIILPIEWKLIEADTFPHFIAELTTQWQLPSARPMPDYEKFGIVPAEHLDVKASPEVKNVEDLLP